MRFAEFKEKIHIINCKICLHENATEKFKVGLGYQIHYYPRDPQMKWGNLLPEQLIDVHSTS